MNKKTISSLLIIILLAVVIAIVHWFYSARTQPAPITNTLPPAAEPPTAVPVAQLGGTVFENDYIKFVVAEGWQLTEATRTLQDQEYDKNTGTTIKIGEPKTTKTGAVNITKGKYILYINPQAGQASGVEGGRFGEIAGGAPSADVVIVEHPSPPCGTEVVGESSIPIPGAVLTRHDLYISSEDKQDYCAAPTNGKNVWYFSYLTTAAGGYFNYYKEAPLGFVITMAYNSKDINSFPVKGTPELYTHLRDMGNIVKTIQFKPLAK